MSTLKQHSNSWIQNSFNTSLFECDQWVNQHGKQHITWYCMLIVVLLEDPEPFSYSLECVVGASQHLESNCWQLESAISSYSLVMHYCTSKGLVVYSPFPRYCQLLSDYIWTTKVRMSKARNQLSVIKYSLYFYLVPLWTFLLWRCVFSLTKSSSILLNRHMCRSNYTYEWPSLTLLPFSSPHECVTCQPELGC